jgi:hypothetical protein
VNFPDKEIVSSLRSELHQKATMVQVISNPTQVAAFLEAIRSLKGWYWWKGRITYAIPQATVVLTAQNGVELCRVDVGTNWLGSACGVAYQGARPPLIRLTSSEALYFRSLVGGTWELP